MIPFMLWAYCVLESPAITAILVVLSGLTDVVDGFIARRFNMISDLGKALDPVADKLTQIAILFCLVTRFPLILLPLILIIVKEVSAGVLRAIILHKAKEVEGAVWHGKANTVILYTVMFIHIVWYNIPIVVSTVFILVSTAMMLLSFVLYSVYCIKRLAEISREAREGREENNEKAEG
jgi:cardiolipin synthase